MTRDRFVDIAPGLLQPDWDLPEGAGALLTTRAGGQSTGPFASFNLGGHVGDDPAAVAANRARLRGFLPADPLWLNQVHGAAVADSDLSEGVPEADAVLARSSGRVCAVLTADCLPVLLCDDDASVVAAAHAGWRGLAAGVLEATLDALALPADQVLVWLGPAIGAQAFEVGAEVREAFIAQHAEAAEAFRPSHNAGKFMADIYQLARIRLAARGVTAVYGGDFCTYNDPRFYSYRRSAQTGRFASLIWLGD